MKILVIDVGGTRVKLLATGQTETRKIESGPDMTAEQMVEAVKGATGDWENDRISIGYPGFVIRGRLVCEPANLGEGWVGFDFEKAFGKPVKILNDAAMQALGSYQGGKMLFLGLGTGLGSALILDGGLEPMELAHLPYKKGRTFEDYLGLRGLHRMGKKKWINNVHAVVERLRLILDVDDVVLGGGNAKLLEELPPGARLGDNANAFIGGTRMWEK
jgi:predicted NBD/HSP70 family sugar kinase